MEHPVTIVKQDRRKCSTLHAREARSPVPFLGPCLLFYSERCISGTIEISIIVSASESQKPRTRHSGSAMLFSPGRGESGGLGALILGTFLPKWFAAGTIRTRGCLTRIAAIDRDDLAPRLPEGSPVQTARRWALSSCSAPRDVTSVKMSPIHFY